MRDAINGFLCSVFGHKVRDLPPAHLTANGEPVELYLLPSGYVTIDRRACLRCEASERLLHKDSRHGL